MNNFNEVSKYLDDGERVINISGSEQSFLLLTNLGNLFEITKRFDGKLGNEVYWLVERVSPRLEGV